MEEQTPTTNGEDNSNDNKQPIINVHVPAPNITVQPAPVNIPELSNAEAINANKISSRNLFATYIGIVINFLLFGITLYTFYQTKRSVDISEASLRFAIVNDSLADIKSKKADSIAEVKSRKSDSVNSAEFKRNHAKDSLSLLLSQSSIQAQLAATNENENEFELEHRPIFKPSKPFIERRRLAVIFKVLFQNLGKYPVKVTSEYSKLILTKNKDINAALESIKYRTNFTRNLYVHDTDSVEFSISERVDSLHLSNIMMGDEYLYAVGEIRYSNISSSKEYAFRFGFEIGCLGYEFWSAFIFGQYFPVTDKEIKKYRVFYD